MFEVEHERIGRRAALKIVHREGVAPGVVDRLFIEARAVNLINHPHVVEISDILVPDAEQPDHALVMELLDGRSLADVLSTDGPLPPTRYLPIMAQVCAGLEAVHRAGFVHRDLKPENVFVVDRDGNRDFVKLLDFGLVKALGGDVGAGTATIEGTFMGSPAYASPEQSAGKVVDQRSDIYAVGVMLYELVTGKLPFECEHIADLLMKQINAAPPRLSDELRATTRGGNGRDHPGVPGEGPGGTALSYPASRDMFGRLAAGDHAIPMASVGAAAVACRRRRRAPRDRSRRRAGRARLVRGPPHPRAAPPPARRSPSRRPSPVPSAPVVRANGKLPPPGDRRAPVWMAPAHRRARRERHVP